VVAGLSATPIDYQHDFARRLRSLPAGGGIDVVLDGIGGRVSLRSYRALGRGAIFWESASIFERLGWAHIREDGTPLSGPRPTSGQGHLLGGVNAGRRAGGVALSRNKPGEPRVGPAEGCIRNHNCHNRYDALNEALEVTMPAVTAETLNLPRLPHPTPEQVDRPVVSVTTALSGLEGEGFPVRRAFAGVDLATLDPFVHMDQMGEVDYAPGEPKGTPWHPHRGFETVTYMIDGIFQHQDSNGGGGLITDGDTQWMTAGAVSSIC